MSDEGDDEAEKENVSPAQESGNLNNSSVKRTPLGENTKLSPSKPSKYGASSVFGATQPKKYVPPSLRTEQEEEEHRQEAEVRRSFKAVEKTRRKLANTILPRAWSSTWDSGELLVLADHVAADPLAFYLALG